MGSVRPEGFAIRLKTRNSWKPFAYGRIASATRGSVVTVELRRLDTSGIALAFAILCIVLFGSLLALPLDPSSRGRSRGCPRSRWEASRFSWSARSLVAEKSAGSSMR